MPTRNTVALCLMIVAGCLACISSSAFAQTQSKPTTYKDMAYAEAHAAQKLDVYLAAADKPVPAMVHIHGGGWRGGSKAGVPGWLTTAARKGWLSVVSTRRQGRHCSHRARPELARATATHRR